MRRENHVRHVQQLMARWDRLGIAHVEGGGGELAALKAAPTPP